MDLIIGEIVFNWKTKTIKPIKELSCISKRKIKKEKYVWIILCIYAHLIWMSIKYQNFT